MYRADLEVSDTERCTDGERTLLCERHVAKSWVLAQVRDEVKRGAKATYIAKISKRLVGWGQAARATANVKRKQDGEDMLSGDSESVGVGIGSKAVNDGLDHQLNLRATKVMLWGAMTWEIVFADNCAHGSC